jgi:PAS domain S-box-containing protein
MTPPTVQHSARCDTACQYGRRTGLGLRAGDNRFIATFEQTAVGLTHSGFDGRFVHVNRRFCRMLGYDKSEVLALPPGALTHADDRARQGPAEGQLLNGEIESIAREQRYLHKDGRAIWVRVTTSLARNDNGAPGYFVNVVEDISERKQVEEHHRATVMQAPIGIMQVTLQGDILQVNPKLCEITGYPREALLSMNSTAILYGGKRSQFEALGMDSLLAGEIPSVTLDKRVKRNDGARIWVRCTISVVRDAVSQPQHLICIIEDVSGRKEAEDRYRATVDNAPVGIMHTALDKSTLHVNSKLCEMLGYTEPELLRLRSKDIVPAEHYGADNEQFERLNEGKIDSFASERPLICKDGRIIWVNRTVSAVRDSSGRPMYHVRVMVDITERKYAALALVESEIKFRQLAENIPEVFWITDVAQRETLYVSAAYEKITGVSGAPLQANPGAWLRSVHPEDRRRVYQARKALPQREYNIEYRVVRPDGAVRWIHDQAFPVLDQQQRAYRIAGIANDITRRKEAEEKLV